MSMLYFHINHFIYCIKCLIVVFMETLKSKTTIEQRFGSAMRFYDEVCKRGFQAEISRATGVDTSNLSSIIRSDKGASEQVRRDIFEAAGQRAG